jgi:flagellar protein FlaI
MGIKRLLSEHAIDSDMLAYLWQAIESDANMVIAGAPASGKTSLMISLLSLIPRYSRVIIIEEDTNELMLESNFINSVNLNSSQKRDVQLKDQVINALHIRPDRIIVGELRGSEAKEVFSAGNLGIPFMTTLHSNIGGEALLDRLLTKPMSVEQSLHSLDVAIFMEKIGQQRRISKIVEYKWVSLMDLEIEQAKNRRYEILEIATDCRLNQSVLANSKIIQKYAKHNVVLLQKALSDHKKRSKFLNNLLIKESTPNCAEYIQSYGV